MVTGWSGIESAAVKVSARSNAHCSTRKERTDADPTGPQELYRLPEADFEFAPGLNVIVGENGAGKSHVLKAAYTVAAVSARGEKDSGSPTPTKSYLETAIAKKLRGVFPAG